MENKHKLIPNTLIIGNEHLSYSISKEPIGDTERNVRLRSEALKTHRGVRYFCLPKSLAGPQAPF